MRFRILGPLEVDAEGRTVALGGAKPRAVLAVLLLHANEPVSAERIALALWGEDAPAGAVKTVQVHVSRLRKALADADVLTTEGTAYRLRVRPGELDAHTFDQLVAEGREALAAGDAEGAAAALRDALSLWRGPPLHELASLPFAPPEIERLEEQRLAALEARVEADLATGRHAELVGELQRLTSRHPWREHLQRHLMLALYRCGRQAEALAVYRETRRLLADELGLEPGQDLRRLEAQMLAHDPELDPPELVAVAPPATVPPEHPAPARKLLSVVFADVARSTALAEQLDPESMHGVLDRFSDACSDVLERHGGSVEKFIGDAVVGVFGLAQVHEDDALRAVRAAVEMRTVAASLSADLKRDQGVELELKIAVNSGEAFVGAGARREPFATGDAINVAARLQDAAAPGEILLGELTWRLAETLVRAEPLEPLAVAGRRALVPARRLLGLRPDAEAAQRTMSATSFIGRTEELDRLRSAFARATREADCHFVTLLGNPGIGKSRLASEFIASTAAEATAVVGRCPAYGEGNSFSPLAEIVRQLAGSNPERRLVEIMGADEQAESIARKTLAAIGLLGEPVKPEETAWAVRRLLERVARARPLVVVVDDVHWAGPTLLDLLEHVAAFSSGAPILLVCIARPELLESRPAWAVPHPSRSQLVLDRLPNAQARRLVGAVAADGLESQVASRIVDTAEGNPLFLEQLVAAQAEHEEATLPLTLQTVLTARIDRLEPGERTVLRYASIEGRSFHPGALAELLPEGERAAMETRLLALFQKQLVDADRSELAGEDGFRFAHGLIREVAYEGVPKQLRAELHERIAGWLTQQSAHHDEIIGFHLERAYRYRVELGHPGERERALAREASSRLASASQESLVRGDPPAGARLLERATALLPPEDSGRHALLLRLGAALFEAGRLVDADGVLAEAIELARASGDQALEARALVEREFVRLHAEADTRLDDVRRIAASARDVLGRPGDDIGQCRAWSLSGWVEWTEGHAGAADEAWRRAAGHARRAGDGRELFEALCWRASAAVFGPTPVPAAISRCREIRDQVKSSPVALAATLHPLGALHAMTGDFETARRLIHEGNEFLGEFGRMQSAVSHHEALVEMLGGRPAAAEQCLRIGYEKLEQMGERGLLATTAAMLAQALYAQGRYDEAEAQCGVSEVVSAPHEDVVTHVMWRGVRAKLLAQAGRPDPAAALAREALGLIERTDLLTEHGDALLDLAEVLRLSERSGEADDAARSALDLYVRKGNLASASRARSWLGPTRNDDSTEVEDAAVPVRQGGHARRGRHGDGARRGGARDG
jgi:DNA-binding SARP family transcriptional activator/tetratricopeptide (TPR) repeat protein